jgi:hypothetical protein
MSKKLSKYKQDRYIRWTLFLGVIAFLILMLLLKNLVN